MNLNKIALALTIALVAGTRSTQATVIYYDNFSGASGPLAGRTPTVDVGTNTWNANGIYSTNGSQAVASGASTGSSAFLLFSFQPGLVYALSVDLSPTSFIGSSADWLAFGFGAFSNNNIFHGGINDVTPWALTTNAGSVIAITDNAASNIAGTTTATGAKNYEIILDTTGTQWKAEWLYNNSQYASYTYPLGQNPTGITSVGIGAYLENGTIDNFELMTIPEPSSLFLCGLGVIGLFVGARRRRRA